MYNQLKNSFKIKVIILVLAIFGLLGFSFGQISASYDVDCSGKTGESLEKCKKEAEEKAEDLRKLIELKAKQEQVLQDQLQIINLEKQKNLTSLRSEQERLVELTEQINDLENQIAEKEKAMSQQKEMLSSFIRLRQESFQKISGVVFFGLDVIKVFSQNDRLDQISFRINEALDNMREIKKDLENSKDSVFGKKIESEKAKEDLRKKGLTLQSNEDVKESQVTQTQKEKSRYEQLLSEIENEIYYLEAGKGQANLTTLPPVKKGYFTYPTSYVMPSQYYGCLTSSFAKRSYPACKTGDKSGGFHNGVDFPIYSNAYAAKSGKVIATGNNGKYAYGKWIVIDHGDKLVTLYGHLSNVSVSNGSKVKEGQKIGVTGTTGYSTGTHLHFSVFSKESFEVKESSKVDGLMLPVGASVNPMRYL